MSSIMQAALRDWFNGSRDYAHGASLFCIWSDDPSLKNLFLKGASDYTRHRLHEELEKLYSTTKQEQKPPDPPAVQTAVIKPSKNPDLEQACDDKAMQLWKQMMNDRAVLFNLTKVDGWDDINTPDLVEKRRVLALQVCAANYQVSKAYSDLEFVRDFGHLPQTEEKEGPAEVADVNLTRAIDNLRENLRKLRKRAQTPERLALIQRHEAVLEQLLERWNTIKSGHEK